MKRDLLIDARDSVLTGAVNMALLEEERGNSELAAAIRSVATKLARQYKLSNVPGLPETRE